MPVGPAFAAVAVLALIVAAGQWGPKATEATLPPPTATSVPLPGDGTVYLSFDVSVHDNDLGQGTCHFVLQVDVHRYALGLATPGPLDSDRFVINRYSDLGLSTEGCQFQTIFVPITITPKYEAGYGTVTEAQTTPPGFSNSVHRRTHRRPVP